jgi:hypothetical protein
MNLQGPEVEEDARETLQHRRATPPREIRRLAEPPIHHVTANCGNSPHRRKTNLNQEMEFVSGK